MCFSRLERCDEFLALGDITAIEDRLRPYLLCQDFLVLCVPASLLSRVSGCEARRGGGRAGCGNRSGCFMSSGWSSQFGVVFQKSSFVTISLWFARMCTVQNVTQQLQACVWARKHAT